MAPHSCILFSMFCLVVSLYSLILSWRKCIFDPMYLSNWIKSGIVNYILKILFLKGLIWRNIFYQEIFNESIIFMGYFSIGIIDIHKKNTFKNFFFNSKWPPLLGSKNKKRLLKKYFTQSLIVLHLVSLGDTLGTEPTIS